MNIRITEDYFKAKLEELTLTLEYQENQNIKKKRRSKSYSFVNK